MPERLSKKMSSRAEPLSRTDPAVGVVMRFPPKAAGTGIRQMESGGFRVASSSHFKSAKAVPNAILGGAHAQGTSSALALPSCAGTKDG